MLVTAAEFLGLIPGIGDALGAAVGGIGIATQLGTGSITKEEAFVVAVGLSVSLLTTPMFGGLAKDATTRPFKKLASDMDANHGNWKAISLHAGKSTKKGGRKHGTIKQTICQNKEIGETIARHPVPEDHGRLVDDYRRSHDHPRAGD